jgi:hypothetical protein
VENTSSWLVIACVLAPLAACEVVADFDRQRLDEKRTIGPTPLPSADGAVAVLPDAATRPDGALVGPAERDAGELDAAADAAADASDDASTPALTDAAGIDAALGEVDPLEPDATMVINAALQALESPW